MILDYCEHVGLDWFAWGGALVCMVLWGAYCFWLGFVYSNAHYEPEPCTRKHRDER